MRALRTFLLVTIASAASVAVPAAAATAPAPPVQPVSGFGSTAGYISATATRGEAGSASAGTKVWWWEPATLRDGARAPLVVFLHGFGVLQPDFYQAHIDHLWRQGYVVVFPQFNLGGLGILFDNDQNKMLQRAQDAVDLALASVGDVVDADRVVVYGHSLGATLGTVWNPSGGVPASRVVAANPSIANRAPVPVTPVPVATLLPQVDVPVTILTGNQDTIATPIESFVVWYLLAGSAGRELFVARTDTYGDPDLRADHLAPLAPDSAAADAVDHRYYWATLDAALTGAPAPAFDAGAWSDGRPVFGPVRWL